MGRVVPLPVYVSAQDVQASLGCCRSLAYRYLRDAAGRGPEQDGRLLRVALEVWQAYAEKLFGSGAERRELAPERPSARAREGAPRLRLVVSAGESIPRLRETQPRRKERA